MSKKIQFPLSALYMKDAEQLMPGGVSSPVRSFSHFGITPPIIIKAKGAYLYDIDGNKFIDFCQSWGASILGHSSKAVVAAVKKTVKLGSSFGASTPGELLLARLINKAIPSMEKIRFVSSGTEAVMSAVRAARAFTKRADVIKFNGCYHGHSDMLMVKSGSGLSTQASSAGIPEEITQHTISIPYNSIKHLTELFEQRKGEIAAVVLEPAAANMGVIVPDPSFLSKLRNLCTKNGAVLIFDEVITGFRFNSKSIQVLYSITPDLTTVGKIIGGGFPAAAVGGKAEIMDLFAPLGPVYQAGTLSGNPVAMAAGAAVLEKLNNSSCYEKISENSEFFFRGLSELEEKYDLLFPRIKGIFSIFFGKKKPSNFEEVKNGDEKRFSRFYAMMLKEGIYFSPSAYETNFINPVHNVRILKIVLEKLDKVLALIFKDTKR